MPFTVYNVRYRGEEVSRCHFQEEEIQPLEEEIEADGIDKSRRHNSSVPKFNSLATIMYTELLFAAASYRLVQETTSTWLTTLLPDDLP
jgi:hypothetical protein